MLIRVNPRPILKAVTRRGFAWPILLVTATTNLALWIAPPHPLRYLAAFGLLWLLPGLAWSLLLTRRDGVPTGEEILVGLGLGLTTTVVLTLLLHYLPGRLTTAPLLASGDASILLLTTLAARRGTHSGIPPRPKGALRSSLLLSALLLLTVTLRFVNLGYSEFQGDEGTIMVRAARALEGDDGALFMHQKGPIEILLPMATWRLSGTIDEFWARVPFAYAGVLGVLAVALLGRRLFDDQSGWLAGWLMAISGYHVAFGRIVQYQSVVLLVTATALVALWRWSEGDRDRWLFAAAALLALGGLSHYDAIMALPPALYLIAHRLTQHAARNTQHATRILATAALLGLALLATFYLPYALSPHFGKTVGYLSDERIGSGGPIYDNLGSSFVLTTVYNSTWYVGGLILLTVCASAAAFRGRWRLLPLLLVAVALFNSTSSQSPFVPFMALGFWWFTVLISRHVSHAFRLAWLWFGAPFLFFHFLVWDPRTHVLNLFPGACLLAAWQVGKWQGARGESLALPATLALPGHGRGASGRVAKRGRQRIGLTQRLIARARLSVVTVPLLLCFGLLVSYYPFWMFVDHTPEILRTWPAHRHALFPNLYDEVPPFGLFGFPHRGGWKAIGGLFDAGKLTGPYASNEEVEVTGWYTRGAERTYCPGPELYIVADQVQDEIPLDWPDLKANYQLAGTVDRSGSELLRLYTRNAPAAPTTYWLHEYTKAFDAATTPSAALPPPPRDYVPVKATLGDQVRLLGYRLNGSHKVRVAPGDAVELTLYWEALTPLERSYHVFTHLYRDGVMWGQADSVPQCGLWPTLRWQPGEVVADRYHLTLRPDIPAGAIPLTVGMYTLPDGTRLPIHDAQGQPLGDALTLTTVEVGP